MENKKLLKVLRNRPEKYPHHLERQFPRVLERIMELWGSSEADHNFFELLVDRRGDREGFPGKVAEEIFFLSELHALLYRSTAEESGAPRQETERIVLADAKTQQFRASLESRGIKFIAPEFFRCISGGDLAAVVLFVNAGMAIDTPNEKGWTPLMVALFDGKEEVALFLIKKGADVHFADNSGYQPLHWAAFQGYAAVIGEIVGRGGIVNVTTHYAWTPLMQAAALGHRRAVEVLLDLGAQPNTRDNEGWSPLHKACSNNHREVVQILIHRGSAVDLECADGTTALHIAARLGHEDLVDVLLINGANPVEQDAKGVTPLHLAAGRGDARMIDRMLETYRFTSPRDKSGATPLLWSIRAGTLPAARRLIAAGARIQETLALDTTAASAARSGLVRAVAEARRLLLPADTVRRASQRLHRGIVRNDAESVRRELAHGANPNVPDGDGPTPLEAAAMQDNIYIWWLLAESGAGRLR